MRRTAFQLGLCLAMAWGVWLSAVIAAEPPVTPSASKPDPLSTTLSVKQKDAEVREMLVTVFEAIGVSYVISDEVSGRVWLGRENATARDILDLICAAKGLYWWKKGETFVVSAKPPQAAAPEAAGATTLAAAQANSLASRRWRSYSAQNLNPGDLASLFNPRVQAGPEMRLWKTNFTGYVAEQMLRAGNSSSFGSREFMDTSLKPFNFGASRLGEAPQFPIGGGLGITPGIAGAQPLGAQAAPLGEAIGAGAVGNPSQVALEEQELLAAGVNLGAPFAALLPRGMTAPIAYEPLNLLIFEATDEAYDRFLELVRLFDQKPKQVTIEVQYLTVSTADAYSFGINWLFSSGANTLSISGLAPAGNISFGYSQAGRNFNIQATLSALMTRNRARLIQSPIVSTMNNFPANISFVDQIPYVDFSGAIAVPNGGIIGGGATIRAISVPTQLSIVPRINGDDSVTMILLPQVSSTRNITVPTPDGGTQTVPLVSTSSLSTIVNVKDGDTVVIGGFINQNDNDNEIRTPLLSDLPIIGQLFTRRDRNVNDSELLIFVTPHVMHDESSSVTTGPL